MSVIKPRLESKKHSAIRKSLLLVGLTLGMLRPVYAASLDDNGAYIAAQKAHEAAVIAPYQAEVQQLATQAEHNAQAPDIQAYVQALQAHQLPGNAAVSTLSPMPGQGRVLIFVSSSMPTTSLVQWLAEARQLQAPVILRGLVDQSLPATRTWLSMLIKQLHHKTGVAIDPVLFEQYGIRQVPAVVVAQPLASCAPNMSCRVPPFDVVYGNVSLKAALQAIAEQGEAANTIAQALLARLRGSHA